MKADNACGAASPLLQVLVIGWLIICVFLASGCATYLPDELGEYCSDTSYYSETKRVVCNQKIEDKKRELNEQD